MKLSKNFNLKEFTRSQTAVENDFTEQFTPGSDIVGNLTALCENVLQPLRYNFMATLYVTSGYRCERLNTAIKGTFNSDHMKGMAADITCKDVEGLYQLAQLLDLPYRQLIYYKSKNFVHISYDPSDIRRQNWILT